MYSELASITTLGNTAFTTDAQFRKEVCDEAKDTGKAIFDFIVKPAALTSTATSTTSLSSACDAETIKQQREKQNESLNAYIESMSDEELERTLETLNLLPSEEETKEITK